MTGRLNITLTPAHARVLDTLVTFSGKRPREVAGDAIILLDSILRGQVPADTLARMTRINYGKEQGYDG